MLTCYRVFLHCYFHFLSLSVTAAVKCLMRAAPHHGLEMFTHGRLGPSLINTSTPACIRQRQDVDAACFSLGPHYAHPDSSEMRHQRAGITCGQLSGIHIP